MDKVKMKKLSLQDGIIEQGKITSLAAAFSLQGKGFRLFLKAKGEAVATTTAPNLIAYGDENAKPCPLVVGRWSESFIKEIPATAISLTDYDVYFGLTEPTAYKVQFDLDGGAMALPHNIEFNYNTVVAKPATDPTREGYTFDEWQSGGSTHNFATALTDNVIITAHWLANLVVTFNSAGGSAVEAQDVLEGDKATEPAGPTRVGYTFDGWYNGETLYDFDDVVTENLTLTAAWLENFTVTFNSDGGSAVAAQEVADGGTAIEPTDPTKEGYTLNGWYNGETLFNFTTPITADITLTAHWLENFTVTFDSQGGSEVTAQEVADGSTATEPTPDPTKEANTFLYWSLTAEGTEFAFTTPITADTTLYAIWDPE